MKKKNHSFLIIISWIFISYSCNNIEKEKSVAEKFYLAIQNQNYDSALALIDSSALEASSNSQWKSLFEEKYKNFGKINSFKEVASYTNENNNIRISKLKYKVAFEKKTLFESIELQTINGVSKIIHYEYNEKDFELMEDE